MVVLKMKTMKQSAYTYRSFNSTYNSIINRRLLILFQNLQKEIKPKKMIKSRKKERARFFLCERRRKKKRGRHEKKKKRFFFSFFHAHTTHSLNSLSLSLCVVCVCPLGLCGSGVDGWRRAGNIFS